MSYRRIAFLAALVMPALALMVVKNTGASSGKRSSVVPISGMLQARSGHSATLLQDGTVLIAGGMARNGEFLREAELFDPVTHRFQRTGDMAIERVGQSSAILPDGKVLIAGGWRNGTGATDLAELYDPATRTFTPLPHLSVARARASATMLPDGSVLITGGAIGDFTPLVSAEIFEPSQRRFVPIGNMLHARVGQTATLLQNGDVLLAGGVDAARRVVGEAEIYSTSVRRFRSAANLIHARYKHTAALMNDGRVLIAGGSDERDWKGQIADAEVYDPTKGKFSPIASMRNPRFKLPEYAVVLRSGEVLIAGGSERLELFQPTSGRFIGISGSIEGPWHYMSETALKNGDVLLAGGYADSDVATAKAWLFQSR